MNYNSVEEIFNAGITNMTVLRNNVRQDDGIDTITGVDWFTFKGVVASNIYASGNSWIGFGASSEHLKVNRRDGALWSLYREEGTLYNYYKFLKIRWRGSSHYSTSYPPTNTAYCVEYDVILWDTGDISLHMINIPTTYNTGTYSLVASSTYTYSVSVASPDVTFTKTDSGFTVNNNIIEISLPYNKRYLIRDGSTYYTVSDGVLSSISVTDITSDVFLNYGIDASQEILPSNILLLSSLSNPELLYWSDDNNDLTDGLMITVTPTLPQTILYASQDLTGYTGIEKMETVASDDALFLLTFNNVDWKYYDGTNWVVANSETEGMTSAAIKNIPSSAWASVFEPSNLTFKCALPTVNSYTNQIYIQYI